MKLPRLRDTNYTNLRDELQAAIPRFSTTWNNFNPSDPGITILELLTYVAETLLFRIDQVPARAHRNYIRLLAGVAGHREIDAALADPANRLDPDYRDLLEVLAQYEGRREEDFSNEDLARLRVSAQNFLAAPYRAITAPDFRVLAQQAAQQFGALTYNAANGEESRDPGEDAADKHHAPVQEVVRVSRAFFEELRGEANRIQAFACEELVGRKAALYVVLISRRHSNDVDRFRVAHTDQSVRYRRIPEPDDETFEPLRKYVADFLHPRKLIGTRLVTRWERRTPIHIAVRVRVATFARPDRALANAGLLLLNHLNVTAPGRDIERGRNQTVSANRLMDLLRGAEDIDDVLALTVRQGSLDPSTALEDVKSTPGPGDIVVVGYPVVQSIVLNEVGFESSGGRSGL